MSQNLQLNPITRDYVLNQGSPIPSDRVLEACYYALTIPQGRWLYGLPGQGSKIYLLENVKRTSSVEQQFSAYASAAIQAQVINTGQATAVQVKNLATSRTGTSNQINVIPANTQLSNQLNFIPV